MTAPPGGPPNLPPNLPPGVPPQAPQWPGWQASSPPPRESRGVAFFVAIFLGILLLASAGLNVLLLLLSVGSLAGAGLGDDATYDEVHIAGERGGRTKVLQVPICGAIAESAAPLLGASGGTVTTVKRALRQAAGDDVAGVLLYVDSPGGGVTDSDVIYRLVQGFRRDHPDKPVMALFGDMAASGGYYVAMAAERVLARRTSITGSIGVIMSAWNFTEAADKVGVDQVVIKSERTPYKDMLSPFRPLEPAERAMLTSIVDELFDLFVDVVDEGRPGLDRAQVLAAANGGIYSASQAKALGLVDDIGDHDAALAWFRDKLGKPVTIVEARRRVGWGDLLFGSRAGSPPVTSVADLLGRSTGPRFLYYWEGGR
jgi:protease-4